jgi:hypothetical protein
LKSTKLEEQPWENPYWKEQLSLNPTYTRKEDKLNDNSEYKVVISEQLTSAKSQDESWKNPYWKDDTLQTPRPAEEEVKLWVNPYWKDQRYEAPTSTKQGDHFKDNSESKVVKSEILASTKRQDEPWKNPYWKEINSQKSTPSKEEAKPWTNPYWKEQLFQDPTSAKQENQLKDNSEPKDSKSEAFTSRKSQDEPWKNPYWKDDKSEIPVSGMKADIPVENRDWKGNMAQASVSSKKEDKAWENPYWKDKRSPTSNSSSLQNQPGPNSYWNDKSASNNIELPTSDASNKELNGIVLNGVWTEDNLSPPDHTVPPVPPFYKRIFPVDTPPSSPTATRKIIEEKTVEVTKRSSELPFFSSKSQTNNFNRDDDDADDILPYTIDSQRIAHYRSLSPSPPAATNKIINFGATSQTSQNPWTYSPTADTTPLRQTNNIVSQPPTSNVSPPLHAINGVPPSLFTNSKSLQPLNPFSSLLSSPNSYPSVPLHPAFLTVDELVDIQNALRSLDIRPDAVITVETFNNMSTGNSTDEGVPYSSFNALITNNKENRSMQQPSFFSQHDQSGSSANVNSPQRPTFASSNKSSTPKRI